MFYGIIGLAVLIFIFEVQSVYVSGVFKNFSSKNPSAGQEIKIKTVNGEVSLDIEALLKELLPDKKTLPVTWQGIPYQLVEKKIIDIEALKEYSRRYGQEVRQDDLKIFEKNYNGNIEITPDNSILIYNILWAIGFTAKSPILDYVLAEYGWDTIQRLAGYYFSFANLGNGSTLPQAGYNYFDLTPITQEQKDLVMKIAGKSAVPSCGVSLLLPDCSCAFAVDAIILLMANQGFSEKQIYQAMKDIYPYRFPGIYVRHALFFKLAENQTWEEINPEELVSMQFSSAQGVAQVSRALASILNQVEN